MELLPRFGINIANKKADPVSLPHKKSQLSLTYSFSQGIQVCALLVKKSKLTGVIEMFFAFVGAGELIVLLVGAVGCLAVIGGIVALVVYLNKKKK